jgi:Bardet-Biedl syndrome 5 protein
LTSTAKQRFEFIFTDYGTNPKHFASLAEIYKTYQATTLYRELKLRSAILTDGQLNILPQEQVYKQLGGIYNLSSDQVRHAHFPIISLASHIIMLKTNSNFIVFFFFSKHPFLTT